MQTQQQSQHLAGHIAGGTTESVTTDGRESVHSGRSSANDKER